MALLYIAGLSADALADQKLETLLHEYFLAPSAKSLRATEKKLLAIIGLSPKQLSGAIHAIKLWPPRDAGDYELTLRLGQSESTDKRVLVHVPTNYDPAKPFPLIIAFHGQGANPESILRLILQLLGDLKDDYIVAAPDRIGAIDPSPGQPDQFREGALAFTFPEEIVGQPRELLTALRRQFHIDSDRVFLTGFSIGSHNTWMAAVMHNDCFAGIMPLATPLQVVGNDVLYEDLLSNLLHVPVLFCWGDRDTLDAKGRPEPNGGNAGIARLMAAAMKSIGHRHFTPIELPGAGHLDVLPPRDKFLELLKSRRVRFPREVHQRFRLPEESVAYWISTDGLRGEPLSHETLQIPQKPGDDPRTATRRYLLGRLGLIKASCQGQTITINPKKCMRVTLLLSDELVDLDKPVTIRRGRKTVFKGKIPRDLRVMLREAARAWDFDRLPSARVVIPVAGEVEFGYPDAAIKPKKTPSRRDR